jgi:hypothetical protein
MAAPVSEGEAMETRWRSKATGRAVGGFPGRGTEAAFCQTAQTRMGTGRYSCSAGRDGVVVCCRVFARVNGPGRR